MWSKKGLQRGIPYEVKNPLVGVLTSYGVPSRGQNQKIPSDSSSPCQKTPQHKKSAKFDNFLKIRNFDLKGGPRGQNFEFSKSYRIWLIFCAGGFFGMGNSNPKEFFDFDHGTVPHTRLKPQQGGFLPRMGYLFVSPFLTTFPRSRTKINGGFVFSAYKNPRRVENFVKNRLI